MNEIDTLKSPEVGMFVSTAYGTATIWGVYPNANKRMGWVYLKYHTGKADNKPHRLVLSRSQKGVWYLKYVKEISFSDRDDYRDLAAEENRLFEEHSRNIYSLDLIDQVTERLKEIGDDEITKIVLNLLNKIN